MAKIFTQEFLNYMTFKRDKPQEGGVKMAEE